MLQYFKGQLRTLPGRWGNSNTPNRLRLGMRTDRCAGIDPGGLPCGIGRALQGNRASAARGGAQNKVLTRMLWNVLSAARRSEPELVTVRLSKLAEGERVCACHP